MTREEFRARQAAAEKRKGFTVPGFILYASLGVALAVILALGTLGLIPFMEVPPAERGVMRLQVLKIIAGCLLFFAGLQAWNMLWWKRYGMECPSCGKWMGRETGETGLCGHCLKRVLAD